MKKFTPFVIGACMLLSYCGMAQNKVERAYLGPDGEILKETFYMDMPEAEKVPSYNQLPGWPKKVGAHPNFKNFRGVTLADITGDGKDEILVAGYNRIQAFNGAGQLIWTRTLTGTAIYPPSVAVMDGSGTLGIVQVTGGVPNNGRIYYLNSNGDDMPGWPLSFANHWILCSPVIADVNGDGVSEIIVQTRTSNNLHVLKTDGTPLNANWPVDLGGTPAVTPSVADIDNDGSVEIITATSDGVLHCFTPNGSSKPGFPVPSDNYSFSYQSPLLVDFDGNDQLSIVGSTHGNAPKFYVRNPNGTYRTGWPVPVEGNSWTYSPPTVVDLTGDQNFNIFMSRPIGEAEMPMLYGFNPDGSMMPNFPISKSGGLEGFISVADINLNGQHDLVFGSNMMVDGQGFIHAWEMDGSGQLPGFPLRPIGFTFMNGANLGDVNGDGMLNLVALSYEQSFQVTDSTFINVYDLQIPIEQANVLFGTYKGSNDRRGFVPRTVAQAEIVVAPASHNFGEVGVGQSSQPQMFTISNIGNAPASITGTAIGGFQPGEFTLNDENTYPLNLLPDASITVEVAFSPQSLGFKTAQLTVAANVAVPAASLSGTGVEAPDIPVIFVTPNELFINEDVLVDVLYIYNQGTANLLFEVDIEYLDEPGWLILSADNGMVEPGEYISLMASFDDNFEFSETIVSYAKLLIESNDPETPLVEVPVTLIITVGLDEVTSSLFIAYPIPASDKLIVEIEMPISHLQLINSNGKVIHKWKLTGGNTTEINVSAYQSGVYLLQVVDKECKVFSKRVIIKN
jgi:hypothetical protein